MRTESAIAFMNDSFSVRGGRIHVSDGSSAEGDQQIPCFGDAFQEFRQVFHQGDGVDIPLAMARNPATHFLPKDRDGGSLAA